jgi:hypothetical protein
MRNENERRIENMFCQTFTIEKAGQQVASGPFPKAAREQLRVCDDGIVLPDGIHLLTALV